MTQPGTPGKASPVALDIVTANWLKSNDHAEDLLTLSRSGAHLIGLNEGREHLSLFRTVAGYRLVSLGTGSQLQNPVLVRSDVEVTRTFVRTMCASVNGVPARAATVVCYRLSDGVERAHIQTHANSSVEQGGKPKTIPRVNRYVDHMKNLTALVQELRAAGYLVTVAGDLNWAWDREDTNDWTWSPESVFDRLGMTTAFDAPGNPPGGTLGSRDIDYVAYDADDLVVVSQRILTPEHSDHRWSLVRFVTH